MSKFCSNCGNVIKEDAKFCDKCGHKQESETHTQNMIRNNNVYTINPKKKKGCLIAIILIIFVPMSLILSAILFGPDYAKAPKDISIIMQYTNTKKEQANNINEILKQCDITNVKEIKHDEMLDGAYGGDEKGFRINTDLANNIILYLRNDNTVYYINYADHDIYNNNQVISKISDYALTLNEKSDLQYKSEQLIKQTLKSPSTADFPNINEWKYYKDKEKIIIQSYVDSQNSFGAKTRGEFRITMSSDQKDILSLIIDGKEYLK